VLPATNWIKLCNALEAGT